jgi:hypothetical protein
MSESDYSTFLFFIYAADCGVTDGTFVNPSLIRLVNPIDIFFTLCPDTLDSLVV